MLLKKFIHHQKSHLVKISDGKVLFEIITLHQVEDSYIGDYRYIKYQGEVINDIITGISFEYTSTVLSDFENYKELLNKLAEVVLIDEKELLPFLLVSIHGEYEEPFNTSFLVKHMINFKLSD